ncbi:MAG: nicotinate-nucleotide adenylyltransferase [candidate division WOR-3 bacterium]
MRLGILGGCFDPIHFGHLLVAEDVFEQLQLDRILFIPTFCPPRRPAPAATFLHRVQMVSRAIKGDRRFRLCRLEEKLPCPSYTVNTLQALHQVYPGARFYLIIGFDQYHTIHTWHQPEKLTRLAQLIVVSRPGVSRPPLYPQHQPHRVKLLDVIPVGISARIIRQRLALNKSIRYLVPPVVAQYIYRHRLYLNKKTKEELC